MLYYYLNSFNKIIFDIRDYVESKLEKMRNNRSNIGIISVYVMTPLRRSCVERFYYGRTVKTNIFDNMKPLKDASLFSPLLLQSIENVAKYGS